MSNKDNPKETPNQKTKVTNTPGHSNDGLKGQVPTMRNPPPPPSKKKG